MHSASFVHLNVHTEYSFLDSLCRIEKIVEKAREYSMPAAAITDSNNLCGAVEFYTKALDAGIKPIIGCELHVGIDADNSLFPLTLLSKNLTGYKNLIKLSTAACLEGFSGKTGTDKELLKKHPEGLVILSGFAEGEISLYLLSGESEKAERTAREYRDIAGHDFYLEIQDDGTHEGKTLAREIAELSDKTKIPLAATNNCRYIEKKDAEFYELFSRLNPVKKKHNTENLHFKSPKEMEKTFGEIPRALSNTIEIADKCDLRLEFRKQSIPRFKLPPGKTRTEYLAELCSAGLKKKNHTLSGKYSKRVAHELGVIKEMGFEDYFLMTSDFVNFAKEAKCAVGPGRGSAAGSLVAYALGITDIDPIEHGLVFERFLNKGRKILPDIDIDFSERRRGEIVDYAIRNHKQDKAARIAAFGRIAARSAVRDAGRALGIEYSKVDRIARKVPPYPGVQNLPGLEKLAKNNPEISRLVETAKAFEGIVRHAGTHAAGIVISDRELVEYTPLMKSREGKVITQYPMDALEKLGLLKVDFLGLRTLDVIEDAVSNMEKTEKKKLDLSVIPPDDEKTFNLLKAADTTGVFQFESRGMRELLKKIKPQKLEDIAAVLALYRPGPLSSGMVDDFIRRKHGEIPVTYDHPSLEPVLRDTHGIILYQEQIMMIASVFAGLSLEEADGLHRAIRKKNPKIMESQEESFVSGATANGADEKTARRVFELIAYFAGYGSNKAHSTAYAVLSYRTAYLKANHPLEFFASLLSSRMRDAKKLDLLIKECVKSGTEMLPPDINKSSVEFKVENGAIRYGLGGIKNLGGASLNSIVGAREEKGDFKSFRDFCEGTAPNKKTLESLINAGAFDCFGESRDGLLNELKKLFL